MISAAKIQYPSFGFKLAEYIQKANYMIPREELITIVKQYSENETAVYKTGKRKNDSALKIGLEEEKEELKSNHSNRSRRRRSYSRSSSQGSN